MANTREIVLSILIEYDRGGVRKPSLLKDSLNKYDYLETRDKSFIKRLVEGVIERQIQIDFVTDSFSRIETKKMQPFIRSLIRMSVYQILFMDQVPDSAACDEAVKLAKRHRFDSLSGFVNGVLRNIARNKEKLEYPDKDKDGGVAYLSVIYSMPEWICRMWVNRLGMEKTEEILKFFLEARPTTVRIAKGTDVVTLERKLKDLEVDVQKSDILPYAYNLTKTDNIAFLPGFDEGEFFVQDVSSMLVTEIADPKPGDIVIDVCAAPGGKSLHAAERIASAKGIGSTEEIGCGKSLHAAERIASAEGIGSTEEIGCGKSSHAAERIASAESTTRDIKDDTAAEKSPEVQPSLNSQEDTAQPHANTNSAAGSALQGCIISRDVSGRKCELILENAERMRISNIKVEKSDAGVHDQSLEGKADILYLDLPCSGLGIIGRKSDIKYNVSQKSLKELTALQWKIIRASWDYVKPGGILMYSTCTVNKAENEDMVKRICEELPFEPVDFFENLPERLKKEAGENEPGKDELNPARTSRSGYIQLLPGEFGTDGFFIAKLRRK